jgi:hypothetical protein
MVENIRLIYIGRKDGQRNIISPLDRNLTSISHPVDGKQQLDSKTE